MKRKTKKIDLIAFSRKGGLRTKELYGSEHYSRIQKKSVRTIFKRYGKDYYKNMAKERVMKMQEKQTIQDKSSIDKFLQELMG